MTIIEIEPDVIVLPDEDKPESHDADTDEFPDTQKHPEPDWNV